MAREPSLECAEARSLNSWRCTSENLQVIARLDLYRETRPLPCSEGLRELTNKVHWSSCGCAGCCCAVEAMPGIRAVKSWRPASAWHSFESGSAHGCSGRLSTPLNWSPGPQSAVSASSHRLSAPVSASTGIKRNNPVCQLSNLMHAVSAFDDHTADDELSVHSLPARIAEVLRNNEYRLNARRSVEDGMPFRYIRVETKSFTTRACTSVKLPT